MPRMSSEAFRRYNEMLDEEFFNRVQTSGRTKIGTCLLYSGRSPRVIAPDVRVGRGSRNCLLVKPDNVGA
jgi:hypothetical protein